MAVCLRGRFYHYDFQFRGFRYRGSTNTPNREKALAFQRDFRERLADEYAGRRPLRDLKRNYNEVFVTARDIQEAVSLRAQVLSRLNANPDVIKGEVYFISDGTAVKIGYARSAKERLEQHKVSSPVPLKLLASLPGCRYTEKFLHVYFWPSHMRGEWFALAPNLAAFIEIMRTQPIIRLLEPSFRGDPANLRGKNRQNHDASDLPKITLTS